jgi:hypothetical protein
MSLVCTVESKLTALTGSNGFMLRDSTIIGKGFSSKGYADVCVRTIKAFSMPKQILNSFVSEYNSGISGRIRHL